jgi:cytidylate kinase
MCLVPFLQSLLYRKMLVALDGPAAAGKSSTAREVAARMGLLHVDTGLIYRVLALRWQSTLHTIPSQIESFLANKENVNINWRTDEVELEPVSASASWRTQIRTPEVANAAGLLAQDPKVRAWVHNMVCAVRPVRDLVVSGRDVGTVMFPDADLKIFLTADLEVRARRRLRENGFHTPSSQELHEEGRLLEARDRFDRERKIAPLRCAKDAVVVDTSTLRLDEQVGRISTLIEEIRRKS